LDSTTVELRRAGRPVTLTIMLGTVPFDTANGVASVQGFAHISVQLGDFLCSWQFAQKLAQRPNKAGRTSLTLHPTGCQRGKWAWLFLSHFCCDLAARIEV
jgi:hypothetical protein